MFKSLIQRRPKTKAMARLVNFAFSTSFALTCSTISTVIVLLLFSDIGAAHLNKALMSAFFIPISMAFPITYILVSQIFRMADLNDKLAHMATHDCLTGSLNRGAFQSEVEEWMAQANSADEGGALLVIDADHFKRINDNFGHAVGDEALQEIVNRLYQQVRKSDLIGRLGGEEFAVFLKSVSPEQAANIAERMRDAIANQGFKPQGSANHVDLSVSIGHASAFGYRNFNSLYRAADHCLYRAKTAGRNRVETSSRELVSPGAQALSKPRLVVANVIN